MIESLFQLDNLIALVTLTALEIVLGIDNIVFISILTGRLPAKDQPRARRIGLSLAMFMRIGLLLSIGWVMKLTEPFFSAWNHEISGRDLILLVGGLFLVAKSTHEIHNKLEGEEHDAKPGAKKASFASLIFQIVLLDIVFSLYSVITAVGMSDNIAVMVLAVMIAVGFMLVFSGSVSDFVHRHPTVKMLALSFLMLIGVMLIADGFHHHIPKGYVYFAMAFSVMVEILNLRAAAKHVKPIELREPTLPG
jgi:predicted tellurium resistance membrane protein TerC